MLNDNPSTVHYLIIKIIRKMYHKGLEAMLVISLEKTFRKIYCKHSLYTKEGNSYQRCENKA